MPNEPTRTPAPRRTSRGGRLGNPVILREYHEHIARLVLAHCTVREIAQLVGLSHDTVTSILEDPEFNELLSSLKRDLYSRIDAVMHDERASIVDRIQAAAPRALSKLFDLVENARSEHVRHRAAVDVLGMAGIAPVERRVEASVQLTDFTPEQQAMLTQAISTALQDGSVALPTPAEVIDTPEPPALTPPTQPATLQPEEHEPSTPPNPDTAQPERAGSPDKTSSSPGSCSSCTP